MDKKKHKILIFTASSDLYGANKILLQSITYLAEEHDELVMVLPQNGPIKDQLSKLGVQCYQMNLGVLRRKYLTPIGILGRFFTLAVALFRISLLVYNKKITLIYSNTLSVVVGAMAARLLGKPHVWHVQEILTGPKALLMIYRELFNTGQNHVIAASKAVYDCWAPHYKEKSNISVIHSAINQPASVEKNNKVRLELGIKDDQILIGMIGRVSQNKGQSYFMEIAQRVHRAVPHTRFLMAGDVYPGNEYLYDELAHKKSALRLEGVLFDLGYRTDVDDIMRSLDVFVLPSVFADPFPTVILEAMGHGVPVAATCHGGALEMLEEGVSGFFIPVHRPDDAARTIESILNNPRLRRDVGKAGRERVLHLFSADAFKKNILSKFESI